jgi:hypothetical protein
MLEFDFKEYVYSFRYRCWRIDRVGARASKVFALHFVFGLEKAKTIRRVTGRLNKFRRLWISRLRDLASRELWLPGKDCWQSPYSVLFNIQRFASAFRRCMFCRPCVVHFCSKDGHAIKLRPCWRARFCPFCWANLVVAQYVYVKQVVNRLVKAQSVVCTVRVLREDVAAPGFNGLEGASREQLNKYAVILRRAVQRHQAAYQKLMAKKQLARRTLGSLWRIVVIPTATGWAVETRQFFILKPNKPLPAVKIRRAKVTCLMSTKTTGTVSERSAEFFAVFGEFCRYPVELLTAYAELVAVYLWATRNLRLMGGTGALRQTGRVLMKFMRKLKNRDGRVQKTTQALPDAATPARQ